MDKRLTAEIERKAYERYLERDGSYGDALEDWLEAEKEVRGKAEKALHKGPKIRLKEKK